MPAKSQYCGNRECCNPAKMVCARCCCEFYCSKPCQIRAFTEHRFNCFELPSLRTVDGNDVLPTQVGFLKETKSVESEVVVNNVESEKEEVKSAPIETPVPKPQVAEAPVIPRQSTPIQQKQEKEPEPVPQPVEKQKELPRSSASVISNLRMQRNFSSSTMVPTQALVPKEPQRIVYDDLKVRLLPSSFRAIFLEGNPETKKFTVCQIENHEYLSAIGMHIIEYLAKNDTMAPYKPRKEEVVLASFEEIFYRGVCKNKKEEGYEVFYVDYGNSAIVKECDLRPFHKSLMFDVVAHSCIIENFPEQVDENVAAVLGDENGVSIEKVQKIKDGGYSGRLSGI